jgi:hypothetical protein
LISINDGHELVFGRGLPDFPEFLPSPNYLNIKLAVGRVLRVCGAAEVVEYLFHKYEESRDEGSNTYLEGSSNMLDLVDISLSQIAVCLIIYLIIHCVHNGVSLSVNQSTKLT